MFLPTDRSRYKVLKDDLPEKMMERASAACLPEISFEGTKVVWFGTKAIEERDDV